MTKAFRPTKRRPDMRKAVFLFPSGLTLLNLFFGVFAIIAASRLEFTTAGVYVVIGGICDALDGRVARATNAGTQFGEELDSLVDAITFGLAPGMIMYFAVLNRGGWDWVWVFAFAAAAVLRLARFNIEQAGTAKTYFQGLPSPAAGITLASYYWFSQSSLYSFTQTSLNQYGTIARLPWHVALRLLMAVLAALMISNVPYPTFPRTGFRSLRSLGASFIVFGAFALLLTGRLEYFFPIALVYVAFGLLRWMLSGLFERRQPTVPYDLSEGEDDEEEEEELELSGVLVSSVRHHRDEPAARTERPRGRADRPARPEREPRAPRADRAEQTEKTEVAERTPRADKADRPQRTEAERAARREKREKRDKREGRPDRAARPDRADHPADVAAATGVEAITVGEVAPEVLAPEEVVGRIPGGAETPPAVAADGAPTRKRKRRRRRGERKDRNGAPLPDGSAGDGDQGESDGADDGPADAESRSPYASSPPPIFTPSPAPTLAAPAAAPEPASAPSPFTPPPSSSSEPHE